MKILVIGENSKGPLINTKILLQVKGKDSGFLSLTSDAKGQLELDDKYNGQQITATHGQQLTEPTRWITVSEGAKLIVPATESQKSPETIAPGKDLT